MLLPQLKKVLVCLVVLLIVGTGFLVRLKNMRQIPFPGESMDEYSNAWVGMTLIESGLPIGISGLPGYPHTDHFYINVDRVFQQSEQGPQAINYPWFDHPPMMGLLVGGYAKVSGASNFEDATLATIRRPMIVFGTVTVLLVFLYANQLFGMWPALIASAIYASSPLVVTGSRLAQAENGYLPLALLCLLFIKLGGGKNAKIYIFLAGLVAGAALLFKVSAISVLVSAVILIVLTSEKKQRMINLLHFLIPAISVGALFLIYGFAIDPHQFLQILISNSTRHYGIGAGAVYRLLVDNKVTGEKSLTDGWVIAGWIGSFYFLSRDIYKKSMQNLLFVLVPLICVVAVYLLFGSNPFGWYAFPIYPFIFIALGYFIYKSIFSGRHYLSSFLLLLFPIGIEIQKVLASKELVSLYSWWRSGLPLIIFMFLIFQINSNTRQKRLATSVILIFLLFGSLFLNLLYNFKLTPGIWYQTN